MEKKEVYVMVAIFVTVAMCVAICISLGLEQKDLLIEKSFTTIVVMEKIQKLEKEIVRQLPPHYYALMSNGKRREFISPNIYVFNEGDLTQIRFHNIILSDDNNVMDIYQIKKGKIQKRWIIRKKNGEKFIVKKVIKNGGLITPIFLTRDIISDVYQGQEGYEDTDEIKLDKFTDIYPILRRLKSSLKNEIIIDLDKYFEKNI